MAELRGTGELHKDKTTARVNTGAATTERLGCVLAAEPNLVALASSGAVPIFGVALWTETPDNPVTVIRSGDVLVVAGAAVAVNAPLMMDGAGKFITCTSGNHAVGRALTSAAALNDLFLAEIYESGYILP